MSDTLRDVGFAVLGTALFCGLLQQRAEQAIHHDLSRQLKGGTLHVRVEPRGWFGALVGEGAFARVTGSGLEAEDLPLHLAPGRGLRARIRFLDVDLTDVRIHGVSLQRVHARIPSVSLDATRLMFQDRIVLRSAGEGTAEFVLTPAAIEEFVQRKFAGFDAVHVGVRPGIASLSATVRLFGDQLPLEAEGRLGVADGRYVVLLSPTARLNGRPLSPALLNSMLGASRPLFDVEHDLGMGSYLTLTGIEVGDATITVRARAALPVAASPPHPPEPTR